MSGREGVSASETAVREIGRLKDMDGLDLIVGIDYGAVTIHQGRFVPGGGIRLFPHQLLRLDDLIARATEASAPYIAEEDR